MGQMSPVAHYFSKRIYDLMPFVLQSAKRRGSTEKVEQANHAQVQIHSAREMSAEELKIAFEELFPGMDYDDDPDEASLNDEKVVPSWALFGQGGMSGDDPRQEGYWNAVKSA